jgi:hypothetical protein
MLHALQLAGEGLDQRIDEPELLLKLRRVVVGGDSVGFGVSCSVYQDISLLTCTLHSDAIVSLGYSCFVQRSTSEQLYLNLE